MAHANVTMGFKGLVATFLLVRTHVVLTGSVIRGFADVIQGIEDMIAVSDI